MKGRKIAHIETEWMVIDYVPFSYLGEGVRMKLSSRANKKLHKVTATIELADGISSSLIGTYKETRYCYSGETTFDFTEYLQQVYEKNIFRLIPAKFDTTDSGIIREPYYRRIGETTEDMTARNIPIKEISFELEFEYGNPYTYVFSSPFVVIDGENPKQEDLCDTRKHLLPVNFPSVYEFTPTLYDVDITLQFDNGVDALINDEIESILRTKQISLTDIIDERFNGDFRTLKVSCPFHLSTQTAKNELVEFTESGLIHNRMMMSDVREDVYFIDKRTKGAFLRFFDRFGYVQQILLDIQSEETQYTQKKVGMANNVNDFGYVHLGKQYQANYNLGLNDIVSTSESRVLHCGLESFTNEIKGDLEDLSCSQCVALLEIEDGEYYWKDVIVQCPSVIEDKRKSLIDYKCDILIGSR